MVLLYPAFVLAERANELFQSVEDIPDTYYFMWMEVYPSAELKVIEGGGHGFSGSDEKETVGYMQDYLEAHRV